MADEVLATDGRVIGERAAATRQRLLDAARLFPGSKPLPLESVSNILCHIEMWKNRIALEYHVGGPPVCRDVLQTLLRPP